MHPHKENTNPKDRKSDSMEDCQTSAVPSSDQNCAHGLFANSEQSVFANEDVAWLHDHDRNMNIPDVHSLATGMCGSSRPAPNECL